jgi:hypothetical protein
VTPSCPLSGDREPGGARRIVSGIDRPPHTVSTPPMDADRFDALSRALTTAPSRRKTLGALLGALLASALPGSVLDPLATAGKRTRKGQRHATRKDRQREAARLESGEVRASDVGAASHCLPPGAKPCRNGSQCCSGRCKRKKKKCLPCATGTEYCPAQEKCVAPGQCGGACAPGTADCDGNGSCETNTTNSNQHCGTCNNLCGTGQTCVNSVCSGSKTCSPDPCPGDKVCNGTTGFCTCPDNTVQCEFRTTLCTTDPQTDSKRCGLNCIDCSTVQDGYRCCSGECVNGCAPNTDGSCATGPCGTSCTPCTFPKICCNLGAGTVSQCVDRHPVSGKCPTATP